MHGFLLKEKNSGSLVLSVRTDLNTIHHSSYYIKRLSRIVILFTDWILTLIVFVQWFFFLHLYNRPRVKRTIRHFHVLKNWMINRNREESY